MRGYDLRTVGHKWFISCDGNTLSILTPLFWFTVAHEGYHLRRNCLWNGFAFGWRGFRREVAFAEYVPFHF